MTCCTAGFQSEESEQIGDTSQGGDFNLGGHIDLHSTSCHAWRKTGQPPPVWLVLCASRCMTPRPPRIGFARTGAQRKWSTHERVLVLFLTGNKNSFSHGETTMDRLFLKINTPALGVCFSRTKLLSWFLLTWTSLSASDQFVIEN